MSTIKCYFLLSAVGCQLSGGNILDIVSLKADS